MRYRVNLLIKKSTGDPLVIITYYYYYYFETLVGVFEVEDKN